MVDLSLIWIGQELVVRYMRYKGSFPAKDYFEQSCSEHVRARFIALVRQLGITGKLPDKTFGHHLKGQYSDIYELKPKGVRFYGFFSDRNFYVTNAAPKRKAKAQESDHKTAVAMRQDFFARLKKPPNK